MGRMSISSATSKNHFVREQGKKAFQIIKAGFEKYDGVPDLYVISTFTSVISEMKTLVMDAFIDGERIIPICPHCGHNSRNH